MSTVGAAVLLGIAVALALKFKAVRWPGAILCAAFGLMLGATPFGDVVQTGMANLGSWVASQFQTL